MSHTTTLRGIKIRDSYAIAGAVDALRAKGIKCRLALNAKPRMYYHNQHGECEYVLVLEDSKYDVGFKLETDGTYTPVFDEWNGYVASQLSNKACKIPTTTEERAAHAIGQFLQNYTKCATINAAASQGMSLVEETVNEEGEMALIFE